MCEFSIYAHDKEEDDIERHLAAIQIQEVFRRRLRANAAKEAQHQTRLPRPYVQQVFCGHRNSRTMVNIDRQFCCCSLYISCNNFDMPLIFCSLFLSATTNYVISVVW